MKVRDVPQDPQSYMPGGYYRYAVDEDGRYQKVHSIGCDEQTLANTIWWEHIEKQIAQASEKVRMEQASPLWFYMALKMIDVGQLAKYVGLSGWRVRRHLKPKVFARLKPSLIQRYADFFGVTADELIHPSLDRREILIESADD